MKGNKAIVRRIKENFDEVCMLDIIDRIAANYTIMLTKESNELFEKLDKREQRKMEKYLTRQYKKYMKSVES